MYEKGNNRRKKKEKQIKNTKGPLIAASTYCEDMLNHCLQACSLTHNCMYRSCTHSWQRFPGTECPRSTCCPPACVRKCCCSASSKLRCTGNFRSRMRYRRWQCDSLGRDGTRRVGVSVCTRPGRRWSCNREDTDRLRRNSSCWPKSRCSRRSYCTLSLRS